MTAYTPTPVWVQSISTNLFSDSGLTTTVGITEVTGVLELIDYPSAGSGNLWAGWLGPNDPNSVVQPIMEIANGSAFLENVVDVNGVNTIVDQSYSVSLNTPYLAEVYYYPTGGGVQGGWFMQWFDANTLTALTGTTCWFDNDPYHTPPNHYPIASVVKETQATIDSAAKAQLHLQVTSLQVNTGTYTSTDYVNWSTATVSGGVLFGETMTLHNGTSNGSAWVYFSY